MTTPIYLVTLLVPINVFDTEEKLAWLHGWDYTIVDSSFAVYKICRVEIYYSDREALKSYSEIDDSIPVLVVGEH